MNGCSCWSPPEERRPRFGVVSDALWPAELHAREPVTAARGMVMASVTIVPWSGERLPAGGRVRAGRRPRARGWRRRAGRPSAWRGSARPQGGAEGSLGVEALGRGGHAEAEAEPLLRGPGGRPRPVGLAHLGVERGRGDARRHRRAESYSPSPVSMDTTRRGPGWRRPGGSSAGSSRRRGSARGDGPAPFGLPGGVGRVT
jgi:hypothetical protein